MPRIFRPYPYYPGSPVRYRYPKWFDPHGLEQQPISDADLLSKGGYRTTMSYNANPTGMQSGFPRRRFFVPNRRRRFASPRYIRNVVRRTAPKDINRHARSWVTAAGGNNIVVGVGTEDPADTQDDIDTNSILTNIYVEVQPTVTASNSGLLAFALVHDTTDRTDWSNWHTDYLATDTTPNATVQNIRKGMLTYRRFYYSGTDTPKPKFVLQPNLRRLRQAGYIKELSRLQLLYNGPINTFEVYWRYSYRKL